MGSIKFFLLIFFLLVYQEISPQQQQNNSKDTIQNDSSNVIINKTDVKKDDSLFNAIITADDISKLPVRDFNNIIELSPGLIINNNQIYIRGSRADETGYLLNEIDIHNKLTGLKNITIVPDAIDRIGFLTGGYNSKYACSNGGITINKFKTGSSKLKYTID